MSLTASDLKSITVGINLNERFEAVSMGLVSVNKKAFTRSGLLKNFINVEIIIIYNAFKSFILIEGFFFFFFF